MGLTYYARGRDLIVDAGHYGYTATPYRAWLQSPEAASTLVLPGARFSGAAATSLIADRIGRYGQFYELYDTAFGGDPRYRSVYVSQQPDLMLVFDRAQGGSPTSAYSQLWHLGPTLRVTTVGPSSAIASAPGTKLTLARVALPGQVIAPGSTKVARGQTDPYQGWVSDQMLQRTPADTVTMTSTGPSAAILTLLVPTTPATPVTYSISGPTAGPWTLRVTVGATATSYTVTADGTIS
jgi:Heparinase II/III-like protein